MRLPEHQIYRGPTDDYEDPTRRAAIDAHWRSLPLSGLVETRISYQLQHADIPSFFRPVSFSLLRQRWQEIPEVMAACEEFAATGFANGKPGLLLVGPPGTGKTSLAIATLRGTLEAIRGNRPAHFWKVAAGLNRIRESFSRSSESADTSGPAESVLDLLANYLVVLDDLGQERVTEWAHDQLYTLIDALLERERKVIVTSNAGPETWQLSEALRSRVSGMCDIHLLGGTDWRSQ